MLIISDRNFSIDEIYKTVFTHYYFHTQKSKTENILDKSSVLYCVLCCDYPINTLINEILPFETKMKNRILILETVTDLIQNFNEELNWIINEDIIIKLSKFDTSKLSFSLLLGALERRY